MNHAMSDEPEISRSHEQWARFRFSVVGPLLAAPPERGQLQSQLEKLAAQKWRHPISGQWVQFGEAWPVLAPGNLSGRVQACAGVFKPTKADPGEKRLRGSRLRAVPDKLFIKSYSYRRSKMDPAEPGISVMRATRLSGERAQGMSYQAGPISGMVTGDQSMICSCVNSPIRAMRFRYWIRRTNGAFDYRTRRPKASQGLPRARPQRWPGPRQSLRRIR